MNHYSFSELSVGQTESFSVTITDEMMEKFREITGDLNPMHSDSEFAKTRGFKDRIVYGMLTASFISTLGGMYLPGEKCLIRRVETNFAKPVFSGDTLTVSGTIKSLDERFKIAKISVKIVNQNGEEVLRGKLEAGVLEK